MRMHDTDRCARAIESAKWKIQIVQCNLVLESFVLIDDNIYQPAASWSIIDAVSLHMNFLDGTVIG